MPTVRYRSRTFRRVFTKTPGGKVVLHYARRKNAKPQCAECDVFLFGVARGTKNLVKKVPRSARRPSRPFGGNLCSACMRKVIVAKARA